MAFWQEADEEILKVMLIMLNYQDFIRLISVLDKYAEKKYVRASNSDFMTKDHRKEIMQTWKLRNKFLEQRADKAKALYNREICVNLLCRSKRNYFRHKNTDTVSDSRIFCKTVNHFKKKMLFIENL